MRPLPHPAPGPVRGPDPAPDPTRHPAALPRRRVLGLAGGAAAALATGVGPGTSTGARAQARSGPVVSMLEMRRRAVVVQEWDLSCGAACLATVLRYQHGDMVTERQMVERLIRRDIYIENPELVRLRQGFSLLDLKRVVEERGYNGFGYGDMSFEDALGFAPVITPIDPKGYNHFVVLLGVQDGQVFVANPAFGNVTMTVERFRRIWMELPDLGHVGFIVTRGEDPAPPGRLRPDPRVFLLPPPGMIRQSLL